MSASATTGSSADQPPPGASASRELVPYTPPGPIPLSARLQAVFGSFWFRSAFVAVAVSAGWAVGALSNRQAPSLEAGLQQSVIAGQARDIASLREELAALQGDLSGLKIAAQATSATVEQVQRNVASSLIQASAAIDRVEAERASDRTKLTDRIDRLEKQVSSPMPTATIPAPPVPKTQLPVPGRTPSTDVPLAGKESSAVPMSAPAIKPEVPIRGYVLRGVADGMALIETRYGLREVGPGQTLPGAGKVQSIERRGRKWVVITTAGLIDEEPYR